MKGKKTRRAVGHRYQSTHGEFSLESHTNDPRTPAEYFADRFDDFRSVGGDEDEVLWAGGRVLAILRTGPNGEPQAIRLL